MGWVWDLSIDQAIINESFQEVFSSFFSYVMMVNYGACALFVLLSRWMCFKRRPASAAGIVLIEDRETALL